MSKARAVIHKDLALLNTREVAKITGVSEVTVRRWRVEGGGPPFSKLRGWAVRYHPDHVEQWVLDNMCVHPSARSGVGMQHGS